MATDARTRTASYDGHARNATWTEGERGGVRMATLVTMPRVPSEPARGTAQGAGAHTVSHKGRCLSRGMSLYSTI